MRIFISSLFFFIFSSSASAIAAETVIFVHGLTGDEKEMVFLEKKAAEKGIKTFSVKSSFNVSMTLKETARRIAEEIKEKNISLICFSWGGLVCRQFAADYGDKINIIKMILIATPNGGYKKWFIPKSLFEIDGEEQQKTPLYLLAGSKGKEGWYFERQNDGAVETQSVFESVYAPIKTATMALSHKELIQSPEAVELIINNWLSE